MLSIRPRIKDGDFIMFLVFFDFFTYPESYAYFVAKKFPQTTSGEASLKYEHHED